MKKTSHFIFKSGTAVMGIIILLIVLLKNKKPKKDIWLIILAFLFSIIGDWFMSHKNGDVLMFSKGISAFFIRRQHHSSSPIGKLTFCYFSSPSIQRYFIMILRPRITALNMLIFWLSSPCGIYSSTSGSKCSSTGRYQLWTGTYCF